MWSTYLWIAVCGALLAVFVAYGIGANDVANAFGSSVGSKAITLRQALAIAAVFEFLGAVLLGANVTDTVRSGIADYTYFLQEPEIYMYGMLCVLLATGIWLIVASYCEMPVSTTHSTVGGVIGMSVCAGGWGAVQWYAPSSTFPFMKGVAAIVLSWLLSPLLSGIFAAVLFASVRAAVLRSNDSYARSWWVFPILVFITVVVNAFFIIFKGIDAKVSVDLTTAVWISFVVGGVACFIVAIAVIPFLKRRIDRQWEAKLQADDADGHNDAAAAAIADSSPSTMDSSVPSTKAEKPAIVADEPIPPACGWSKQVCKALTAGVNQDVHEVVDVDIDVHDIHEFSEKFNPKTEESFKYLQVFTAMCDSFAHGANDVANSIGPFAAIWSIYLNTGIMPTSPVPIWILVLGGFGIVLGLATLGYKIMCAIGVKMVRITPSRGFAIELGAAIVVVVGSQLGIPLSTTHCQVGATAGVGMLESVRKGVNWKLVGKVVVGWLVTLVIVGLTTAAFFSQGAFAPSIINIDERNTLQHAMEQNIAAMLAALNQTIYTENSTSLRGELLIMGAYLDAMTGDPVTDLYAQAVPVDDSVALLTNATGATLVTLVPLSGGDIEIVTADKDSVLFNFQV